MILLLRAFRGERLKLRRSLTRWAIVAGACFTPAIMLAVRLHQSARTAAMHASGAYWRRHWLESWESIAVLILPLLLILVTTLVIQVEYRNNTWKQLHAAPVPLSVLYAAKLAMLSTLLLEIFAVIAAGLLVAGWIPVHSLSGGSPFPLAEILRWSGRFALDCLPIVGLQYGLALVFRNVLTPLGVGVGAWMTGLVLMNTPYVAAVPYAYVGVDYLIVAGHRAARSLVASPPLLAVMAFALSLLVGFVAYVRATDRGAAA